MQRLTLHPSPIRGMAVRFAPIGSNSRSMPLSSSGTSGQKAAKVMALRRSSPGQTIRRLGVMGHVLADHAHARRSCTCRRPRNHYQCKPVAYGQSSRSRWRCSPIVVNAATPSKLERSPCRLSGQVSEGCRYAEDVSSERRRVDACSRRRQHRCGSGRACLSQGVGAQGANGR